MTKRVQVALGAALLLVAVGYQASLPPATDDAAAAAVPLFTELGTYHRSISTTNETAQRYFDQGLRLTYAFNHGEAIRAFEEALRQDSTCAICHWGIAYAYGPNINAPMDAASGARAYDAVQRALALAAHASDVERALIDALSHRYAADPGAERAALDAAYAGAMAAVKEQYPEDLDVVTLHAEAVMTQTPWNYWSQDGSPHAGTAEIVADLERVLGLNPDHPGACHYYIHAVEAVHPEKAVACAERLAALMPGAGHLVHMPAHIYIRVGRWADAIAANEHAVHSDETYIADQSPAGLYPMAYYPHNYHFLSFAAMMSARATPAIDAARALTERVPVDAARAAPPLEPLLPYLHLTLVTFGRWDEVLALPQPPADLRYATALTHYARGVAFAARGEAPQARSALDSVQAIAQATSDELTRAVIDIAMHALMGEIAWRSGDAAGAEAHFRQAVEIEDGLLYVEPPHWYYPVRHSLGAVLLGAGRAADAESVYREDLRRFPENAWALHGLAASLRAQGENAEADVVAGRLAALNSDIQLAASRF